MDKVVIITGANRGLGKALADQALKDEKAMVISLSRTLHEDHQGIKGDRLVFIKTDLSEPFDDDVFQAVNNYIKPETSLYFFSNAGIILPIDKIGAFDSNAIDISMKVNVHYPVALINYLLQHYSRNRIVLVNISSGAGENPVPHWSLYCSSKAYMKMFFRVLQEELKGDNIRLYSINPGVLDTDMQANIRKNEAPKQDYFQSLKDENKLIQPDVAALRIFEEIKYKI